MRWKAGQFVMLNVPDISYTHWHPYRFATFSILLLPSEASIYIHVSLSLSRPFRLHARLPCSISSSPSQASIVLHIKVMSKYSFTYRLAELARRVHSAPENVRVSKETE